MASAFPVSIIDDDGFDWDAAVREIDVACEATSSAVPSASSSVPPASYIAHKSHPHQGTATALGSVKECKSRQSTLDMFISRKCPRKSLEEVHTDHGEFNGDNDRVCHVQIDREAAKTWIYPVNVPLRDYQFSITKTALFSNTLVALPTGLGKTLIAAVVIYNYFRWFPEGKIIFAAPSRPLVMQQIEACHNVVGIPQEWTIDMTGSTSPPRRAKQWKEKRVFFLTPQILENDIKSGSCTGKDIVCLVVDEAHRAMGNFAFCGAVRKLMDALAQFRILALSATPGSKQHSIQQVIDNLRISTLEYRNESDQDVSPYVQNRKTELIEVSMGKDALHSDEMLLNVIRPLIGRLCALRVLQYRDVTAWSPSDLLNWRDKFRQAPPPDLAHVNCGEVEGCFSVLITLYHIRKLLSAHGIKPAYDMLEEKLQQGPFARIMGRNEDIHYIKLSMQKSLYHGAPTPKLAKLLEVVTDHFNTKDPLSSRVIIFSNFRGSVRDIMSKLETVGEHVKPTEFIGQSSGKTLKGQSQKVQQEVLKKFRAGVYNVIVATSIGEEGLDIMEVDLVICFDANVSPLRMIQRMGRTGRKHDGRVVLACEGSEMKGYKRKLATSNSMRKHLHNGGRTSFNFHPSPRMVPHIFKPEVQYVELSIEQFVHRGKAMKDDPSMQSPKPIDKLNDTEIQLLKMYFPTGGDCTWNPSLIAFPSCQSFPSRVYEVKHSFRTGMLIDAMQQLQGFSNIGNSRMISVEEAASLFQCAGGECIIIDQSEFEPPNKYMKRRSGGDANSFQSSPVKDKVFISEHDAGDYAAAENNFHCHLFRSEFVSVDPLGRISIMPAPILPYKEYVNSLSPQPSVADDLSMHNNKIVDPVLDEINQLPGTPELIKRISTNEDYDGETPDIMAHRPSIVECHVIKVDQQDVQLSPRLTNFMLSGVVPESPECGMQNDDGGINLLDSEFSSPTKHCRGALLRPSCVKKCEFTCAENDTTRQNFAAANKGTHTPRVCTTPSGSPMASPNILEELHTPLLDLTSDKCSNDWYPDSGNKSETLKKPRKLKRLRRHRDCLTDNMEHKSMVDANPSASTFRYPHSADRQIDEVRGFIDEEAEVSSRSDVSGDEEDEKDCSSYDDSFIDDKTSLSEATTQAEAGSIDMMAIYRRSLLSQSPLVRQPVYNNTDPDFVALVTNTTEKGCSSPKMMDCNSRRMIGHRINPTPCLGSNRLNSKGNVLSANPCSSSRSSVISRKRKLSAHQADIIPPMNLEKQFFASEAEVAIQTSQADKTDLSGKLFYDDDFFEGLDLDAVEAQATLLLKNKAEALTVNQNTYDEPGSPTFDLGI